MMNDMPFSIIQKSRLEGESRLDADYYQPEYLDLNKKLQALKTKTIEDISESVVSFGAYSLTSYIEWQNSGVPYINVGDVHEGFVDLSSVKYISEKADEILKKSRVSEGQVLLTMAGTIGNAAVAHKFPKKVNANQAIAKITPSSSISPYFLVAFLNSKYGRLQTQREIVSSVQANIFLGTIKKFRVPIFDEKVTKNVENTYKDFLNTLHSAELSYTQAEQLFLNELGIDNLQTEIEDKFFTAVINLSEVQEANRLDAEYFNSPCNKMLLKIGKKQTAGLSELAEMTKGVEPGAEAYQDVGKLFIRVSSISKDGLIDKTQKYISEELYDEFKNDYQPQVGEILLTKDASPGMACIIREPVEGIISSGVMRLKLKDKINPEYLTLVLNSMVGRLQAERDAGGSIIAHWKPEQIKNLIVPILPISTQNKIAELLLQSYQARKKATELLEEAKLKVEEMIENK